MMRLDKYLTEMSVGSRSSVKKIIKSGRVYVDGKEVVKPETKIDENASQVMVDGSEICYNKYEYYMLNKPKGCISATNDREHKTVIDIIKSSNKKDLFPVGRLDIDTEGLLLITNNGELAHKLLSPKKHVEKKYYVEVQGILDENDAKIMEILKGRKAIVLLNKSDLTAVIEKEEMEQKTGAPVISISAREETGMEELEEQMKTMFFQGEISFNDEVYITNARHKQALLEAKKSLELTADSIEMGMPEDFFSIDLMNAYEELGSIIGEAVGEDLVNEIFSKFCTGK